MSMKKFQCPECSCQLFALVSETVVGVDFSREGAIEGHPFISNRHLFVSRTSGHFKLFVCTGCNKAVPDEQAQEMIKEVI